MLNLKFRTGGLPAASFGRRLSDRMADSGAIGGGLEDKPGCTGSTDDMQFVNLASQRRGQRIVGPAAGCNYDFVERT